jgi:hypothetical protein
VYPLIRTGVFCGSNRYRGKEITGMIQGMKIMGASENDIINKIIETFSVTKEYVLALLTPQKV